MNPRKGVEENAHGNGLTGPTKTGGAGGGAWPSNLFTKQNLLSRFPEVLNIEIMYSLDQIWLLLHLFVKSLKPRILSETYFST